MFTRTFNRSMELSERIKSIIDSKHTTPSAFADSLGIGRAVISHILTGRNNPSLEVVTRILAKYSDVNPEWLLQDKGKMYKDGVTISGEDRAEPDLFSQNAENTRGVPETEKKQNLTEEKITQEPINDSVREEYTLLNSSSKTNKKVVKIIIYYSDNTFEAFDTANKTL